MLSSSPEFGQITAVWVCQLIKFQMQLLLSLVLIAVLFSASTFRRISEALLLHRCVWGASSCRQSEGQCDTAQKFRCFKSGGMHVKHWTQGSPASHYFSCDVSYMWCPWVFTSLFSVGVSFCGILSSFWQRLNKCPLFGLFFLSWKNWFVLEQMYLKGTFTTVTLLYTVCALVRIGHVSSSLIKSI